MLVVLGRGSRPSPEERGEGMRRETTEEGGGSKSRDLTRVKGNTREVSRKGCRRETASFFETVQSLSVTHPLQEKIFFYCFCFVLINKTLTKGTIRRGWWTCRFICK